MAAVELRRHFRQWAAAARRAAASVAATAAAMRVVAVCAGRVMRHRASAGCEH